MTTVIIIFVIGLGLSAFFSGNETGFYRVTRVRLVMDGLRGDRLAKRLLWLTNNPSLFVATTLIGNNIANYLTSLAIVLGSQRLLAESSFWADISASVLLSPVLFIYGESLPKNLFLKMPNYLLRKTGLFFLFFFAVLLPVSSLLWVVARLLEKLVGQSPVKARLTLARQELDQVLQEGHDAGILLKGQRELANSLFSVANRPIREFVQPVPRYYLREVLPSRDRIIAFARRQKTGIVIVNDNDRRPVFVRVPELLVNPAAEKYSTEAVIDLESSAVHGTILVRMQSERIPIARVVDANQRPIGFVTIRDLTAELFES